MRENTKKLGSFMILSALILLVSCSKDSDKVDTTLNKSIANKIIEDDFSSKNETYWKWRTDGDGALDVSGGYVTMTTKGSSTQYNNAEIYEAAANPTIFEKNLNIVVRCPNIYDGSRGWGFWDFLGIGNPGEINLVWFFHQIGPDGVSNGLIAQVIANGVQYTYPISDINISEWHTYDIIWKSGNVRFYIDGALVATHNNATPAVNLQTHLWVDNANWNSNANIVFQNPSGNSNLIADYLMVWEGDAQ
jgi:hypothetical protein